MEKIKVKIIARGDNSRPWRKQLPGSTGNWGQCTYIFDRDASNYDWLVVIDDVSRSIYAKPETLACPKEHTILVTTEPPTITRYGRAFTSQFAQVITSQPSSALPHPNRIYSQTGNLWFLGRSYDELINNPIPKKDHTISTVCSSKQQKHTIHQQRYEFTQWLKKQLPDLDRFGHGVNFLENKYDALEPYRFHLAIENYIGSHHWTEKFSDPILAHCIPIYYGCPNMTDYFPEESFIAIDINDRGTALERILSLIEEPEATYEARLPALQEARKKVLNEYNLITLLESIISQFHTGKQTRSKTRLYGRKQMRLKKPMDMLSHIEWSLRRTC